MKKHKAYHYFCHGCKQEFDTFKKDIATCPLCRYPHWRTPKPEDEKRGRPRKIPGSPTCQYIRRKSRVISPSPEAATPSPVLPSAGH